MMVFKIPRSNSKIILKITKLSLAQRVANLSKLSNYSLPSISQSKLLALPNSISIQTTNQNLITNTSNIHLQKHNSKSITLVDKCTLRVLLWVIPGELSTQQIIRVNGWISEIKPELTHRFTWKPERKKITETKRGFHYNSEKNTMVIVWSDTLEFLGLIDRPPIR